MSLRENLSHRRSIRAFGTRELTDKETQSLLWAGQGKSSGRGFRTAPSAGAAYPLEICMVTPRGVFHYDSDRDIARQLSEENRIPFLAGATGDQRCVRDATASFVIGGIIAKTASKYGARAERYVCLEAGAAAQNMLLMATTLQLGAVMVGSYDDARVHEIALLPRECIPLVMVSVGPLAD